MSCSFRLVFISHTSMEVSSSSSWTAIVVLVSNQKSLLENYFSLGPFLSYPAWSCVFVSRQISGRLGLM